VDPINPVPWRRGTLMIRVQCVAVRVAGLELQLRARRELFETEMLMIRGTEATLKRHQGGPYARNWQLGQAALRNEDAIH